MNFQDRKTRMAETTVEAAARTTYTIVTWSYESLSWSWITPVMMRMMMFMLQTNMDVSGRVVLAVPLY